MKGRAPAGAAVVVQARQSGGWTTFSRTRASATGGWKAAGRFRVGGPAQVRATVGSTTSAVRRLAVYQWLDLASQPKVTTASAQDLPLAIGGEVLPHSAQGVYSSGADQTFALVWRLDRRCTEVRFRLGFLDTERAQADLDETIQGYAVGYAPDDTGVVSTKILIALWEAPVDVRLRRLQTSDRFAILASVQDTDNDSDRLSEGVGAPRIRCNAARLPAITYDDVPPLGA